jgi:tetratricopeptide (TPR) repeat protein
MAKQPEQRWPTAELLAEAVDGALARTPPRRGTPPPVTISSPGGRRRFAALGALAAAALAAGIAAGALGTGPGPAAREAQRHSAPPAHRLPAPAKPTHHATKSSAGTTPPVTTASTSPAAPAQPTADSLETRGHGLMLAGDYAAAIPLLRQAVGAAPSGSLTYAYALYDLGRSLRLAGDPRAAIPILWRRLAIPNQTDVVRSELQLALQAAGQGNPSGGAAPAPKDGHGGGRHDHGPPGPRPQGD